MKEDPTAWGESAPQRGDGPPRLMTLPEVARMLQLSDKTVRRLVAARRIPCVRLGRQIRFVPSEVFRWVEARKED